MPPTSPQPNDVRLPAAAGQPAARPLGLTLPPRGAESELISVVTPLLNEEEILEEFHRRVSAALEGQEYELVLVDDGSTDRTRELLKQLATRDPRVRPVLLSRNFGHQAALTAGVEAALGGAVVTIDGDLQDPPEVIPELVAAWRDGADIVHAVRHVRPGEPRVRLLAIRSFYRLFSRITDLEGYVGNTGDFRLLSRRAVLGLEALPERSRFLRGLVSWVGLKQTEVLYERAERFAGASKYPLRKLARLAGDGIVAFSIAPLRLATAIGVLFSLAAFIAIPVVIVLKIIGLYDVSGIASVHILVLLVGGVQLLFLGIIGEYLGRSYEEAKRRPVYIAEQWRSEE